MPIKMERALRREAAKKHLTGDRKNAYIYGTMQKMRAKMMKKRKP